MPRISASDRTKIAQCLLGKAGEFPAYFELYETLVTQEGAYVI